MLRQKMNVRLIYSDDLPSFTSVDFARVNMFSERDEIIRKLQLEYGVKLNLNYSLESLKRLEKWYLMSECPVTGNSGYSMPHAIGFYFGETLCQLLGFIWIVKEYPFQQGRFEIGVERELLSIMLTKGKRPTMVGNKKMQSLWRECRGYGKPVNHYV